MFTGLKENVGALASDLKDKVDNKGLYIVQLPDEEMHLLRSTLEDKYKESNLSYKEIWENEYYNEDKEEISEVSKIFGELF